MNPFRIGVWAFMGVTTGRLRRPGPDQTSTSQEFQEQRRERVQTVLGLFEHHRAG